MTVKGNNAPLTARLTYRRPFDWQAMLTFFRDRATPGVECVDGDCYARTLSVDGTHSVLTVGPDSRKDCLLLTVAGVSKRVLPRVVHQARTVFDLDAPTVAIEKALRRDRALRAMARQAPGVRVPGAWDGFELTIRAILGQQISVKAATTIAGRIAARYGAPLDDKVSSSDLPLQRIFPTPVVLSRARFNRIGIVESRAATIRKVSAAVRKGELRFDSEDTVTEVCAKLSSIRGIGDWTAQYVAMRALGHRDAFPSSDLGLLKAIAYPERVSSKQLLAIAEDWRPWRAYAAMLLWGSLPHSGG